VKTDWLGRVRAIKLTDINNDNEGVINLPTPFSWQELREKYSTHQLDDESENSAGATDIDLCHNHRMECVAHQRYYVLSTYGPIFSSVDVVEAIKAEIPRNNSSVYKTSNVNVQLSLTCTPVIPPSELDQDRTFFYSPEKINKIAGIHRRMISASGRTH
jgi:hypothetical protein